MTAPRVPRGMTLQIPVDDVETAARRAELDPGVTISPITTLPGVVAFTSFDDPWGNRLEYYQDIVPSGEQPEPGGSVHDERLFRVQDRDG